jgi:hypothetical protein
MTHEFDLSFGEGLERLLWESSVEAAHKKLIMATQADAALSRAGLVDYLHNYRTGGGDSTGIVPARHSCIMLRPQSQREAIDGIAEVRVRMPVISVEEATPAVRDEFYDLAAGTSFLITDVPTKDIFVETIRNTGEAQYFLLTPEGMRVYRDADDIAELDEESKRSNHLFGVPVTSELMNLEWQTATEWPNFERINLILNKYEISPQDSFGYNSDIA